MSDTSRDPSLLHPELQARWKYMQKAWAAKHPNLPKPILTATYRGPKDQEAAYVRGASRLRYGQSLHNFNPAYAFDVAFINTEGRADWSFHLFEKMASFGDEAGLEWGGRWPYLVDGPHFQLPMTVEMAKRGEVPSMPSIPGEEEEWQVLVLDGGEIKAILPFIARRDVVVRYSSRRKRVYIDVKKEGE
jgi:peptidoglycan L-alanyl-D-glutamate endopeptidase CwlK